MAASGVNLLSEGAAPANAGTRPQLSTSVATVPENRTWYIVVGAICGFAGGVLSALLGYMWWEKYKEQQRAKASQQILKPLLHTLE